jgi:hypothetical protein
LGKTAPKTAHEQIRAHERRRGERHERDKGREREDQDDDHGELRDDQKKEHGPDDDGARHPFDCVAHAIERPAARPLSVTGAPQPTMVEAALQALFEMVSDEPFDAAGAADSPDRPAWESAFERPPPATAPDVAAGTTIDAVR